MLGMRDPGRKMSVFDLSLNPRVLIMNTTIFNGATIIFYLRNTAIFLQQWNWWREGECPHLRWKSAQHWSEAAREQKQNLSAHQCSVPLPQLSSALIGSTYFLWFCLSFMSIIWCNWTQNTLFPLQPNVTFWNFPIHLVHTPKLVSLLFHSAIAHWRLNGNLVKS